MSIDTEKAAAIIAGEVQAAAKSNPEAAAMAAVDVGNFCEIWKKAKPILEAVSGFIGFIPGLGSTAGAVLKGLIKVGDMVYDAQCS